MKFYEEMCYFCFFIIDSRVILLNESVYCKMIWVIYGIGNEDVKMKCFIKEELNIYFFLKI